MFNLISQKFSSAPIQIIRKFSQSTTKLANLKVTVCGASGRTGQTVSLLLKSCPILDDLALYDIRSTAGIAQELSHIDTKCKVHAYKRNMESAFKNAQIVAIVASAPRVPSNEPPFKPNADIIHELVMGIIEYCPKALIAIATTPVNSMVPLVSELLRSHGVYNDKHVFGVTTLNVMRTNTIVAKRLGLLPENVHVPVVGGHSKSTIVPLLSNTQPKSIFTQDELVQITEDIQSASEQMFTQTGYSPFLSNALSVAQFIISLARGIRGEERIVESCLVRSKAYPNLDYLSTPVVLGIDGIQKNLGLPTMSDYEKCVFQVCRDFLTEEIREGEDYVHNKCRQTC